MRRPYTRERYLRIVEALRAAHPDMHISTDVIVGFPGETDEDFAETLSLFEAVRFDMAYIFKYSPRTGTESAAMGDSIPRDVKEARNRALLARLEEFCLVRNRALIGTGREVLVEGMARKGEGVYMGRDRGNRKILFPGDAGLIGRLVSVRIEKAATTVVSGKIIGF
jgi:tRNA-2-methylthio-N6-dimethylallyladenosine synthase